MSQVVFGEPLDTLSLHLWPLPPPGWQLRAYSETESQTCEIDGAGWTVLKRAPGETLRLRLLGGPGQSVTVSIGVIPAGYDEPSLELELPRTSVQGRLETSNGDTATGSVRAQSLTHPEVGAWTFARSDGSFELPFLPTGSYLLRLGAQAVTTFTLTAGQALDLGTVAVDGEEVGGSGG